MFFSCTPKSQPKLSFTLLSVHTLHIIKDLSHLFPKVSYTYLVHQTVITVDIVTHNKQHIHKEPFDLEEVYLWTRLLMKYGQSNLALIFIHKSIIPDTLCHFSLV